MTRAQQGGGGVLKTRGRYGAQRGHPWGMRNGEGGSCGLLGSTVGSPLTRAT